MLMPLRGAHEKHVCMYSPYPCSVPRLLVCCHSVLVDSSSARVFLTVMTMLNKHMLNDAGDDDGDDDDDDDGMTV